MSFVQRYRSNAIVFVLAILALAALGFSINTRLIAGTGASVVYTAGKKTPEIIILLWFPLLVFGYWLLLRLPTAAFRRVRLKFLVFSACFLGLAFSLFPPHHSGDVYYSLYYGGVINDGGNPYTATITEGRNVYASFVDHPLFARFPMPYGPLWGRIIALVVRIVGFSPQLAILFLRAVVLVMVLTCLFLLQHLLRASPDWQKKATTLFVWNPLLMLAFVNELHNDVVIVLIFFFALWAMHEKRFLLAGALLAVGGGMKWIPFVLLPLSLAAVWGRQGRRAAGVAAAILFAISVAVIAIPLSQFGGAREMIESVRRQGSLVNYSFFLTQGAMFLTTFQTTGGLPDVGRELVSVSALEKTRVIGAAGFLTLYGVLFLQVIRRKKEILEASLWAVAACILFFLSWFMPWYVLWLFPFAFMQEKIGTLVAGISLVLFLALFVPIHGLLPPLLLYGGAKYMMWRFGWFSRPPRSLAPAALQQKT